jgi:KaiC/GvpD/RAD55 family RecA-like ATPase
MPATVRDLPRRTFLALLAAPLFADTHQQAIDLFTVMASALSEGNGLAFLDRVDHAMQDYQTLEQNILALTAQNEVLSSIEVLKDDGDEHTRNVELDWFLQIRSRAENGGIERRREVVKCRIERHKKKWEVVSLEPKSLFAPPA